MQYITCVTAFFFFMSVSVFVYLFFVIYIGNDLLGKPTRMRKNQDREVES